MAREIPPTASEPTDGDDVATAATSPSLHPAVAPGAPVGPYRLARRLGAGGMDEVWVAHHAETGREAAVKLPLRALDAAGAARFERGARAAASLEHPRIARVFEYGTGPWPWIAMERLSGEDLEARIARAPLSPEAARSLGLQVCEALAHAHGRGVVHRDLTARNIFLCGPPDGPLDARLLDFGIARSLDDQRLTGSDSLVGTLPYLPPERARGAREEDGAADLWSLGVVLFQAVTGRLPFGASNVCGLLYEITSAPTPDLRARCPSAPEALVRAVAWCLRKEPAQRPASAAALAELLCDDVLEAPRAAVDPAEKWLVSAVYLEVLRDAALARRQAQEAGARTLAIGDDGLLALFGGRAWSGEEPLRAARFAAAAAADFAGRVGVATGRDTSGDPDVGATDVVDLAASLAREGGVWVDEATAAMTRGALSFTRQDDGRLRLDAARAAAPEELPLVGRAAEQALLAESVARAAESSACQCVVLVGAPGMGRSRLLHAAVGAAVARGGVRALVGRGDALRREAPYAALSEAFRGAVDRDPFAEQGEGASPVADLQTLRDRVHQRFEAEVHALAEGGVVVLVIDDAQWVDAASLAALRWLVDALPDAPLCLWVAAEVSARDAALRALPNARVVELGPLSAADAAAVVGFVCPGATDALTAAVVARAEGNPLFLEALARLHGEGVRDEMLPAAVEAVHQTLLHRLDRPARDFLKTASIFGRTGWVEAAVACGSDEAVYPHLRRAGLVAQRPRARFEGAREFNFRSGTLCEVAGGLWSEGARRTLHGEAARWLEARPEATPDEVARHWEQAAEGARAAERWAAAAERALRVGDVDGARACAGRALARAGDDLVRWRALVAQDAALQTGADRSRQREGLAALDALARGLGPRERAEAAWRCCFFARVTDDRTAAEARGAEAIAGAAEAGPWWAAAAHVELALLDANRGRHAEARAHAEAADAVSASLDDAWLVARVATTRAYVLGEASSPAAALALYDRAARAYAEVGDRRREATARVNGGYALLRLGRVDEALRWLDGAVELAARASNPHAVAAAKQNRATALRLLGRLDEAARDADDAARDAARLGRPRLAAAAVIERAAVARRRGESDAAARAEGALQMAREAGGAGLVGPALAALLRARHAAGELTGEVVGDARAVRDGGVESPEAALELAAALWCVTGDAADRAALRARAEVAEAEAEAEADDRGAWRVAMARRFEVAAEAWVDLAAAP